MFQWESNNVGGCSDVLALTSQFYDMYTRKECYDSTTHRHQFLNVLPHLKNPSIVLPFVTASTVGRA